MLDLFEEWMEQRISILRKELESCDDLASIPLLKVVVLSVLELVLMKYKLIRNCSSSDNGGTSNKT